jgi:hypothetical protein
LTTCPGCAPTPTPTPTPTQNCNTCVSYGGPCGTYGNGTWCITPGSCPNICQGDYAPTPTPTPIPTPTPTPTGGGGGTCYVECCYDPYDSATGTYGPTICNGYNIPCDQVNGWC